MVLPCTSLNGNRVLDITSNCLNNKWVKIALIIGGIISLAALSFGVVGFLAQQGVLTGAFAYSLGTIGQVGTIALMAVGGVLGIGGTLGIIISVKECHQSKTDQTKRRRRYLVPIDQTEPAKNTPINFVSIIIGSSQSPLSEKKIKTALRDKINDGCKDVGTLIIYGKDDVEFNADPGIIPLNPKKLILVGAHIVHKSNGPLRGRLDDLLAKKDWETRIIRAVGETKVIQKSGFSIKEALDDELPDNVKHRVYLVDKKAT